MKALITPKHYSDKEIFSLEESNVFSNLWNFAGFTKDLINHNDFITLNIAGIPVVVQNFKGVIKAFKNICSHRFSIIQTAEKGNRPFVCPYHGWAYDENGLPTGIPKKPLFDFTESDIECLKLINYQVEVCGILVFVRLNNSGLSLQEYLGDYYDTIVSMSSSFGDLIDVNEMEINANWKVVVENTLESYHVNLIHKDSFRKLGTSGLDFKFDNYHSSWNTSLKFDEDDKAVRIIHKPYKDRPFSIKGYEHIMLFPNILISTTYGISFNLSVVMPIDENTSFFRSYVFITKKTVENGKGALEIEYEKSLKDFNRTVFDEDKFICQQVQKGVKLTSYSGELSEEEGRVCKFQENYYNLMSK